MDIKEAIGKVTEGIDLTEGEAEEVMRQIMLGGTTSSQIAAFVVALKMKGETVAEVAGAARAMRSEAYTIDLGLPLVVDTAGTGGDGKGTFNISTAAAFVIAGAGLPVAKHGGRGVSSGCGSADLLEALGVDINLRPERAAECIREVGIAFLFAPVYHPAMKHAAGPRREMGIRTIFNLLGPLTNPAGANCQLVGVGEAPLREVMAGALQRLGCGRGYVVHGADGVDEVSLSDETYASELTPEGLRDLILRPEDFGYGRDRDAEIRGGDREANGRILLRVLSGKEGDARKVVVMNAALALKAAGLGGTLAEAREQAEKSIDSGAALRKLRSLIEFTRPMRAHA